ncbi:mitogen-activated protein kinase kinase kinase kinase 2-like [Denticeps clupeoides]|uniref:mitogen-activated protein kinase kinase kinase kinase 2-like n=1 Tax=Denticeps clupeoides TaxID=299321 RepID=UPI0010A454A7|nr:mitogen-activated protein kinase kinase kinase kinase 2-like [Denticeps clupeoides]
MDQMYDDNELEFMQNVNHHNVTNLIEIYYWDKQLYVFMEICGGGSLFGLCYKTGPLTEQEIAYVTTECLQGLHNMHLRGYMHRDIKLKNILLTDAGEVKICDFGLVEKMENKTHEVVGTVMIRAPEVSMAEERGSYDERCDIWSLGPQAPHASPPPQNKPTLVKSAQNIQKPPLVNFRPRSPSSSS